MFLFLAERFVWIFPKQMLLNISYWLSNEKKSICNCSSKYQKKSKKEFYIFSVQYLAKTNVLAETTFQLWKENSS